ncbi:MAG: hypothetical protein HZA79_11020 [Sphingobacteriales bacterium]|nr:hypothetical protein [Sphingobacteriales bacterium]
MKAGTTIRKIIFITVWLCIGAGMFTLLMAAISKKNKGRCNGYTIVINGVEANYFIDEEEVEALLKKSAKGDIRGQQVSSLNLHAMETALERNTWISNAELYIDNQDELHVTVTEKEPVARIFTTAGSSFYIDKSGNRMPLSDKLSARVPVFTGFPVLKKMTGADSVLSDRVTRAANYIIHDPFWLAQVAQIDIAADRTIEMIPVLGNHVVKMGEGEDIERQFARLMVFYKQVMSRTGLDHYKVINVQYAGQVVASRFAGDPKVDSVQLRKNVEKLLQLSRDAENDTVTRVLPVLQPPMEPDAADDLSREDSRTVATTNNAKDPDPVPLKPVSAAKPAEKKTAPAAGQVKANPKPVQGSKPAFRKPRAVMPPKGTEDPDRGYN